MKIQLASDLHLELLGAALEGETLIRPGPGADLLVLAGDVASGTAAIDLFKEWPVPVVYVVGNHEYYGHTWEKTRLDLRRACSGTRIHFLERDAVVVNGIRILGCTLWTDFKIRGFTQDQAMEEVERRLNDFYKINTATGLLRATQTLEDHRISRNWLSEQLAIPFAGKTIVVTHHAPHPLSVHPRFAGEVLNAGFVSDVTELLFRADVWLHGHTHDSCDYRVGRCRVVSNPAGYARDGWRAESIDELELENKTFDPALIIEISDD